MAKTEELRVLEVTVGKERGLRELHPKKKYRIYVDGLGSCRILTGEHTTIDEAIIATVKALGGTEADLKAIKTTFVGARTIRALKVTPQEAGFKEV